MKYAASGRDRSENRAIEAWLRQDFLTRYNDMLNEPLPDDLLALLKAA